MEHVWKIWGGVAYLPTTYDFITGISKRIIETNQPNTGVWAEFDAFFGIIHTSIMHDEKIRCGGMILMNGEMVRL